MGPHVGLAFEPAGLPDSAILAYEHYLKRSTPAGRLEEDAFKLAWVLEHVAALYEGRDRRREARDAYRRLVGLWQNADAELQPRVTNARDRMAALAR